jgi:hypothetical protein
MTVSLDEVRAEVGRLSQGLGFLAIAAGAGGGGTHTASTWVDNRWLIDTTRGGQFYVRSYLLRTLPALAASARARRVQAYDPATGTLTLTPVWGAAPAAGEPYEVGWKWDPRVVEDAIVRVHGRMYTPVEVAIDPVPAQLQYSLTDAADWLERAAQAERIVARCGPAGQQVSVPLDGALLRQVATNAVADLVVDLVAGSLGTGETLVARGWTDYQTLNPLTTPTSTTIASLPWLAWEAIWELCQLSQLNLDDELRQRAAREVRQLRKGSAPPVQGPLFRDPSGSWGSAGRGVY